jgi:hypothetical protein
MPMARLKDRWGIVGSKTMFGEMGGHIFKGRRRKGLNLWPMIVLIVLMEPTGMMHAAAAKIPARLGQL